MLQRVLHNRNYRLIASLVGIAAALIVAIQVGGVILTATLLTLASYIGTLVTLARLPSEAPSGRIKKVLLTPLIWVRNKLFETPLILTCILGVTTGAMVGITTVTGIIAVACSALLGDLIVQGFTDTLSVMKERRACQV